MQNRTEYEIYSIKVIFGFLKIRALRGALGMAEPASKSKRKIKFFWMAEPGHPYEVGVLHNRHPAAGTHEASAKRT